MSVMDAQPQSAPASPQSVPAELHDVWAVVQGWADELSLPDQGVVARARELADLLGCYVRVLVVGPAGGAHAITLGADHAVLADVPVDREPVALVRHACAHLFADSAPEFVLFAASPLADEMAPALADRLDAGLVGPCTALRLDEEARVLTVTRPAFDGLYQYPFTFRSGRAQIVVLAPDALGVPYPDPSRSGEVQSLPAAELGEARVRTLEAADEYTAPRAPLSHARAIVAVGRGLGDEEGLSLAWQLAARLGADLAGDRSARDLGWVDEAHTVGLTGETVAPALYVALGIRGEAEHFYGMADSQTIVALHADAQAPIFKLAHVGWAGDVKEGVRRLLEELEQ